LPRVSAQVSIKVKDSKLPATGPLLIALVRERSRHFEIVGLGCPNFTRQKFPIYPFVNWLNDVDTDDAEKPSKI
jgi:hypothetical protein